MTFTFQESLMLVSMFPNLSKELINILLIILEKVGSQISKDLWLVMELPTGNMMEHQLILRWDTGTDSMMMSFTTTSSKTVILPT